MKNNMQEEETKQKEMEKKREEQLAALAIRRAIQRYRTVSPDKYNKAKEEFDSVIDQYLEACGAQKNELAVEIDHVVNATTQRIEQLEEIKRREVEMEEENKKQEEI